MRVVNASPLIVLAKAGLQGLLSATADEVFIPHAVAEEIESGPESDPARVLVSAGFGERLPPSPVPDVVLEWGLGAGESAVIAEALWRPGAEAILDDAAARRCARSLGVAVTGTLGVIARAKRAGRVPAAAPHFKAVREAGLFFSDELAEAVLASLGEVWSG